MRIAINGFGRIGLMIFRAYLETEHPYLEIVAINDLGSIEQNVHLLRYDSAHGPFKPSIQVQGSTLSCARGSIAMSHIPDPGQLPWVNQKVDLVLECSGHFNQREQAALHLQAGAKQVLVSAPCDGADQTIVYGVNHQQLHRNIPILSNASCTTNCLAPIAQILDQAFGITMGSMTTIHSYTGDQRLVDTIHPDLRRARAAAHSMIPTTTGAAKAVGLVLPHLKGKLDGTSIRVPTLTVSLVDFQFVSQKPLTVQQINETVERAANQTHVGISAVNREPLVSCDFIHHPASAIVDLTQTQVIEQYLGRVLAWYDNEWGFSNRMLDVASFLATIGS